MANPSPWGAFAENLSAGINKGLAYYQDVMKQKREEAIKDIDRQEKRAIAAGQQAYKMFSDENLPIEVRKQAYQVWKTTNNDWQTGIKAPEFPDDYWVNKKLTPYFKRGQAILKNKEYTTEEKMGFLQALEVEAIDALGGDAGVETAFKGLETGVQREAQAGLFAPQKETIQGVQSQTEPSKFGAGLTTPEIVPTTIQSPSPLTKAMGLNPQQAEAMGLFTGAGGDITKGAGLIKPKEAKSLTEMELYQKDPNKYKEFKAAGRAPKELGDKALTASEKEARGQHFIKNYGPTVDKFDRIIEIAPGQRFPRLAGWFRTRGIEENKGVFSKGELDQIEQAIMTGLRVEPKIQSNINLLREQGATAQELKLLLDRFLNKGK